MALAERQSERDAELDEARKKTLALEAELREMQREVRETLKSVNSKSP